MKEVEKPIGRQLSAAIQTVKLNFALSRNQTQKTGQSDGYLARRASGYNLNSELCSSLYALRSSAKTKQTQQPGAEQPDSGRDRDRSRFNGACEVEQIMHACAARGVGGNGRRVPGCKSVTIDAVPREETHPVSLGQTRFRMYAQKHMSRICIAKRLKTSWAMQGSNRRPLPCELIPANLQHPTPTHSDLLQSTAALTYRYSLMLAGVGWNRLERDCIEHEICATIKANTNFLI